MASIRKRGNSYLIIVSMGYDCAGNRLKSMQQTVHPPAGMTPKQTEKWLNEQAVLFELSCKQQPQQTASNMTLAEYSKYWFENIAPNKLASSTVAREKSDIDRFLPHIGHYKLTELRPEHFRKLYVALRKEKNMINGNRYVYFSPEMGTLLKEYCRYCESEALHYEGRTITDNDFLFRKKPLSQFI